MRTGAKREEKEKGKGKAEGEGVRVCGIMDEKGREGKVEPLKVTFKVGGVVFMAGTVRVNDPLAVL